MSPQSVCNLGFYFRGVGGGRGKARARVDLHEDRIVLVFSTFSMMTFVMFLNLVFLDRRH